MTKHFEVRGVDVYDAVFEYSGVSQSIGLFENVDKTWKLGAIHTQNKTQDHTQDGSFELTQEMLDNGGIYINPSQDRYKDIADVWKLATVKVNGVTYKDVDLTLTTPAYDLITKKIGLR